MPQSDFEDGFTAATSGSLDVWVAEVFAKVPGVVEGYIYSQLKLVIKDFFQRTKCWRTNIGPVTALANDGQICLSPADAWSNVIMVLQVTRNGSPLVPTDFKRAAYFLGTDNNTSTPGRFYVSPPDVVQLVPTPTDDVENLYFSVALTPRIRSDNRIQQWIIDQHYEAIKAGLLQRLYEEPGKIYTNNDAATKWGRRYRSEIVRSTTEGYQNYVESPQPFTFNRWNM